MYVHVDIHIPAYKTAQRQVRRSGTHTNIHIHTCTFDDFRGLLGEVHKDEGDGQQRDCCKHMMPNVSLSADHTNWMFEAQNTDILKSLLQNQTVELDFTHGMPPLEYYSIGYLIVPLTPLGQCLCRTVTMVDGRRTGNHECREWLSERSQTRICCKRGCTHAPYFLWY